MSRMSPFWVPKTRSGLRTLFGILTVSLCWVCGGWWNPLCTIVADAEAEMQCRTAHTIPGKAPTTLQFDIPNGESSKFYHTSAWESWLASIAAARVDGSGGSHFSVTDFAETGDSCLPPEHRFLTQEQGLLRIYSQNQTRDIEPLAAWNVDADAWDGRLGDLAQAGCFTNSARV